MVGDRAETGILLATLGLVFSVVGLAVFPASFSTHVLGAITASGPAILTQILGVVGVAFALAGYSQNKATATIAKIDLIISAIDIIIGGIAVQTITS